MSRIRNAGLALLVLSAMDLQAGDLQSGINLVGGYRSDILRRKDVTELVPPTVSEIDQVSVNPINIGQVGFDFLLKAPEKGSCYKFSQLSNFYLDGFAYWGWALNGTMLNETIRASDADPILRGRARLKYVNTYDYQAGLGYLFDMDVLSLGLSGGYAWDRQVIATNHGDVSIPPSFQYIESPIYEDGYKTTTTWKGPWLGAALYYESSFWSLGIGYEYHFAEYEVEHLIPDNPTALLEGFDSYGRSSHGSGNVGFLQLVYFFCNSLDMGVEFKYQNWHASSAQVGPLLGNFVFNGFPETTQISTNGQWVSYSINLNIGYAF